MFGDRRYLEPERYLHFEAGTVRLCIRSQAKPGGMSEMSKPLTIAVIIGSLRKESFTRKFANAAIAQAPEEMQCRIVEIGDLAMYNQDLDDDPHDNPPASWERFRGEIAEADGVLFLTPEYNRSIPACIKNAIDVG